MRLSDYAGIVVVGLLATWIFIFFALNIIPPQDFKPGDKVTRVYAENIIIDGKVCQKTSEGIIAFNSALGGEWWEPYAGLWPNYQVYLITDSTGAGEWVRLSSLHPYDAGANWCSAASIN